MNYLKTSLVIPINHLKLVTLFCIHGVYWCLSVAFEFRDLKLSEPAYRMGQELIVGYEKKEAWPLFLFFFFHVFVNVDVEPRVLCVVLQCGRIPFSIC